MRKYLRYSALLLVALMLVGTLSSCGMIVGKLGDAIVADGGLLDQLGIIKDAEDDSDNGLQLDSSDGSLSESETNVFETDIETESDASGEQGYRERLLLVTDFHYVKNWYGVNMDERMTRMVRHINEEHKKDPLTMIIFMGDYSLDHWKWQTKGTWLTQGVSYTQRFMDKYRSKLPDVPMFWLAGNHEQFGEATWKKMVGNSRQGYEVIQDYLIVMWDSFGAELDPTYHHDGVYTPIDTEWVRGLMNKYPDKKVILISHFFNSGKEIEYDAEREANNVETAKSLISDDRVLVLFGGHNHSSHLQDLGADFGFKTLAFAGNYSNCGDTDPGDHPWGFRDLVLQHDKIRTAYIIPENVMIINGKTRRYGPKEQNVMARRVVWKDEE